MIKVHRCRCSSGETPAYSLGSLTIANPEAGLPHPRPHRIQVNVFDLRRNFDTTLNYDTVGMVANEKMLTAHSVVHATMCEHANPHCR